MTIEINNRTDHKINLKLVKQVVREFARVHKIGRKEISIAIVRDAEIEKLNKTYRQKSEPTDILSFAGEDNFFGELVIDYDQIKRQAGQFKKTAEEEMIFILVHGLLHLLGYNDETEKARLKMVAMGEEFIRNALLLKEG